MTAVVEGRESAYHHRKWTSSDPVTTTVQEFGKAQGLSREMDQVQGAARATNTFGLDGRQQINEGGGGFDLGKMPQPPRGAPKLNPCCPAPRFLVHLL
jgi:hypothetical protein